MNKSLPNRRRFRLAGQVLGFDARSVLTTSCALLLALGGCPPPSGNTGDPNSDANSTGGNNGGSSGTAVSDAARTDVINQVGTALSNIATDDVSGAQNAVLNMLKARGEIQSAGANPDGTVWAVFTDGRPLVVALNQALPQEVADADADVAATDAAAPKPRQSPAPGFRAARGKTAAAQDAGKVSLPYSTQAFLFNSYGLDDQTVNHLNGLSKWLDLAGYDDAVPSHVATIENLQKVKDAGVLYINGHAGVGYLPIKQADGRTTYDPIFIMGTLTPRDAQGVSDAKYFDLLESQQIGYLVIPTILNVQLTFGPIPASRYFITKGFAVDQWTFSAGAWVYADVCEGLDTPFIDACLSNGAGLYLGWDQTVRHSDSLESSQYLFSRVLGMNEGFSGALTTFPSPPQHAFGLSDVFAHMQTTKRNNASQFPGAPNDELVYSANIYNQNTNPWAELRIQSADNVVDPLLIPGIESMNVDDPNGILQVAGSFGVEQGKLLINGNAVEVESWGSRLIRAHIGPNDYGFVGAAVDWHLGQSRRLTVWNGTVSAVYSGTDVPTERVEIKAVFRGDVQSTRLVPDETPQFSTTPDFHCIPEISALNQATVSGTTPCSGGASGNNFFSTPSPLVNATYIDFGADSDGYWFQPGTSGEGSHDPVTGELKAQIAFGARQKNGVDSYSTCGGFTTPTTHGNLDIGSGYLIIFTPGNYDFIDTLAVTDHGITLTTTVDLHASYTPSDDDPR